MDDPTTQSSPESTWLEKLDSNTRALGNEALEWAQKLNAKIDFNDDGKPDLTQLKDAAVKAGGDAADDVGNIVETLKEKGVAVVKEVTKPGGIMDNIGEFLSNNSGGLIGLLGVLLVGSLLDFGPLMMLVLGAIALFTGGMMDGEKGMLSGLLPSRSPAPGADVTVAPPAPGQGQGADVPAPGPEAASTTPAAPAAAPVVPVTPTNDGVKLSSDDGKASTVISTTDADGNKLIFLLKGTYPADGKITWDTISQIEKTDKPGGRFIKYDDIAIPKEMQATITADETQKLADFIKTHAVEKDKKPGAENASSNNKGLANFVDLTLLRENDTHVLMEFTSQAQGKKFLEKIGMGNAFSGIGMRMVGEKSGSDLIITSLETRENDKLIKRENFENGRILSGVLNANGSVDMKKVNTQLDTALSFPKDMDQDAPGKASDSAPTTPTTPATGKETGAGNKEVPKPPAQPFSPIKEIFPDLSQVMADIKRLSGLEMQPSDTSDKIPTHVTGGEPVAKGVGK